MIIEIGVFGKFIKKESFLKFIFFLHFLFEHLNITGLNNDLVLVYFKELILQFRQKFTGFIHLSITK